MATVKELLKRRCPPLPGGAWAGCGRCKGFVAHKDGGTVPGWNTRPHAHKPPRFKPDELERLQQLGWCTAVQL